MSKDIRNELENEYGIEVPGKGVQWLHPLKDCFDNIESRFLVMQQRNKELAKENQKLKDEHFKDKELQEMNLKLEEMKEDLCRGFTITKEEEKIIENFKKTHDDKMHPLEDGKISKAGRGSYEYVFTPSEVGLFGTIICSKCERKARINAKGDEDLYKKLLKEYDAECDFYEP